MLAFQPRPLPQRELAPSHPTTGGSGKAMPTREQWWNRQSPAHPLFPLLLGGIGTPDYLALVLVLVLAAGEQERNDTRRVSLRWETSHCQ